MSKIRFAQLWPALSFLSLLILVFAAWNSTSTGSEDKTNAGTYVGSDLCLTCHQNVLEQYQHTIHYKVEQDPRTDLEAKGCESCHGPGSKHVEDPTTPGGMITFGKKAKSSVEAQNQACLSCHTGTHTGWEGSIHQTRDVACASCHEVMENLTPRFQLAKASQVEMCGTCHKSQKAKTMKSYHMAIRDGKLECSSCHNPHGSNTEKQLVGNSVNETCYRCHADKRGPFLWQHPPVMENCSNCHDPHGSNHQKMLVVKETRLCQSCHVETRHPTTPQSPQALFVFNRSCTNCHSQVHGSNHPSGARFVR